MNTPFQPDLVSAASHDELAMAMAHPDNVRPLASPRAQRLSEEPSLLGRVPPQSLEAEQAVLGGILVDPEALGAVIEHVKPKDFYRQAHQKIFETALDLFEKGEPIDIITVSESLKDKGELDLAGGRSYINDLALSIVTTDNLGYYAEIIRSKSLLRELIRVGTEIVTTAYEDSDAESALDKAQQEVFKVAQEGVPDDLKHIRDILPDSWEQIEHRSQNRDAILGVASGFYDLDNYTSGFQKSDLIILAARPSMGKTAFCLNIMSHVGLRVKKPVLMFSLEMSKESVVQRMICSEAEVDSQRVRTGELTDPDFAKLTAAMGRLGDAPIYIDDTPGLTVMEMRAKARKLLMECSGELGLIVIDYLQLMEGRGSSGKGGENRQQEVSAISRGLKGLARELKVPIIALSQLSRGVESRTDKKPMLSDLRESGSIEQDADLVMFIYRDEYYNPETERPGTADIIIAKQRNGPVGSISLLFRNSLTKFMNPADRKIQMF
jgi:replicative DNA helicase